MLIETSYGRRRIGLPKSRWDDNVKIHLRTTGCEFRKRTELAQDHAQLLVMLLVVLNLHVLLP
jgi:hypothetical protein